MLCALLWVYRTIWGPPGGLSLPLGRSWAAPGRCCVFFGVDHTIWGASGGPWQEDFVESSRGPWGTLGEPWVGRPRAVLGAAMAGLPLFD